MHSFSIAGVQLVGGIPTPLKNMNSSVGMMIQFPTEWKVIQNSMVPVTTNQPKITRTPSQCVNLSLFSTIASLLRTPVATGFFWPDPENQIHTSCTHENWVKLRKLQGVKLRKLQGQIPNFRWISWFQIPNFPWLDGSKQMEKKHGFTRGFPSGHCNAPPPRDISGQTPC